MKHAIFAIAAVIALASPACGQQRTDPGQEEAEERAYVASSRGDVYYWIGCDNWRSLASGNLRWFTSDAEAQAAGYRPSQARGCAGPERRSGPTPLETGTCTVERVIDGDTVLCLEAAERIRLLLVDAPEQAQGEYGEVARSALERLLPVGSAATLELDVVTRDRYDRILAYLYTPSGSMVNEMLARGGYVVVSVHPPNIRHVERIRAAVDEARGARRGLWRGSAFECLPVDNRSGRCD